MSKTLIIGDPHIGKGVSIGKPAIGSGFNSRIIDQVKILDWIFDLSIDNHIDRIIITGDVFEDLKPDYNLVVMFLNWLKLCGHNNILVDIILGNHETRRSGSNYTSPLDIITSADVHNVTIYKSINTVHSEGVSFTFLPYRDRRSLNCETTHEAIEKIASRLPYELADIPQGNDRVLVGHLALEGSIPIGDEYSDLVNELLCPLTIFNGYDYVWMGHIHKPQVCLASPYIAHIGSMDLSDFGETDHVKIVVLYDTDAPNKFTEIPVPSRPLRRVKKSIPVGVKPTDYILELINEADSKASFKDAIVKIEIRLEDPDVTDFNKQEIEDRIYQLGAQYICSFSESRNVSVVTIEKRDLVDSTIDPKAAIKLWADQLGLDENEKIEFMIFATAIVDEYYASIK
jgi:exonuclease SbcD